MINNLEVLNICLYGSNIYGSNDDESGVDYIYVVKNLGKKEEQLLGKTNITIYPADYFQERINSHSVSALECFFLPEKYKIELVKFNFKLDKDKLRRAFSEKSSNSWVKAKKKIDLHKEYRLGMKSLFHSLRIVEFGIQIAEVERIYNYSIANKYLDIIKEQNFKEWSKYKEYWQPIYNNLHSKFRLVAPIKED